MVGISFFCNFVQSQNLKILEMFSVLLDVVRFDNTYSWVRSKSISYQIEVLEVDNNGELNQNTLSVSESDDDL